MVLSAEQIKQIAKEIAFDVHQYIIEHQDEYELFRQSEDVASQLSGNSNVNTKGEFK